MLQKRIKDHEKKEQEDKEKKAKANMKIMAKIAYKEWKEKKTEERRLKKKQERIERRNRFIRGDDYDHHNERLQQRFVGGAQTVIGGGHIAGPINSQGKKNLGSGGGDGMLAYGLNKNLKKIKERPKSAKPPKKNKKKEIHFS